MILKKSRFCGVFTVCILANPRLCSAFNALTLKNPWFAAIFLKNPTFLHVFNALILNFSSFCSVLSALIQTILGLAVFPGSLCAEIPCFATFLLHPFFHSSACFFAPARFWRVKRSRHQNPLLEQIPESGLHYLKSGLCIYRKTAAR